MSHLQKILIVDDERIVRQVLEKALGSHYELQMLASGLEFRDTLENLSPDLVILDICMPSISGLDLCHLMRSKRKYDHIPIIILSALTKEHDQQQGLIAGGDYYMTKPFDIQELRKVIQALLGRKHRYPDEHHRHPKHDPDMDRY